MTHASTAQRWARGPIPLKRPDPAPSKRVGDRLLEFVCAYDYHDEHGELIFQKLRYRLVEGEGRDKEMFYRMPRGERSWSPRKPENADAYLYRLPEVLRAVERGWAVHWPEGEKDCDSLRATGVTATSHHGGAGKVYPEQCEWLTGAAEVWLHMDRDIPGAYDALQRWHGLVDHAGVPPERIRLICPPRGCKDVTEYLEAGGGLLSLDEMPVKRLRRIAAKHSARVAAQHGYGWIGAL